MKIHKSSIPRPHAPFHKRRNIRCEQKGQGLSGITQRTATWSTLVAPCDSHLHDGTLQIDSSHYPMTGVLTRLVMENIVSKLGSWSKTAWLIKDLILIILTRLFLVTTSCDVLFPTRYRLIT